MSDMTDEQRGRLVASVALRAMVMVEHEVAAATGVLPAHADGRLICSVVMQMGALVLTSCLKDPTNAEQRTVLASEMANGMRRSAEMLMLHKGTKN